MGTVSRDSSGTEVQNLEGLIDRIKTEGVAEAQRQADELLADARNRADELLTQARAMAADITEQARASAKETQRRAADAIRLAARDVQLRLRGALIEDLKAIATASGSKSLRTQDVHELIIAVAERLATPGKEITVSLAEPLAHQLGQAGLGELQARLVEGSVLQTDATLRDGFTVSHAQDSAGFEFSAQAVAEALAAAIVPEFQGLFAEPQSPMAEEA